MSLPKAQLVDPQGNMNLPGMTATGIVTASSLKGVTTGSATGLTGNPDLDVGIVTASSFVGQGDGHAANLTGTPQLNLGVTTSTGFVGDAVGKAAGLTGTPNLNVGLITATSFVGFVTGDVTGNITGDVTGNITGNIQGDVEGNVTGNVSGLARGLGINGINVWTGAGTSNLGVGVCTATVLYGDGSGLVGAGSSAYIAQNITATGGETIIDLSYGNLIYYKGDADTTVGFASTSAAEQITFIRDTDPNYSISLSTGGVDFGGTAGDELSIAGTSDFGFGTGDFTIEFWLKWETGGNSYPYILDMRDSGSDFGTTDRVVLLIRNPSKDFKFMLNGSFVLASTDVIARDAWNHFAVVRNSGTTSLYVNGVSNGSFSDSTNYGSAPAVIGQKQGDDNAFSGVVSNLRIVKGTAVYTSNFVPPSTALTNITNTKLLCCQSDSSNTAAAVTPGTITADGTATAGAQTITKSGSLNATITWPDRVKWNGDTTPTLFSNVRDAAFQIFRFTTVDTGLNYNAWEEMKNSAETFGLYGAGSTGYGALGNNEAPDPAKYYSSPVQIPGTSWSSLSEQTFTGACSGAIKSDGTFWVWGKTNGGILGLNQAGAGLAESVSSPIQLGTETTWDTVSFGGNDSAGCMAIKTDGTLWSWGQNEKGTLGHNSNVDYSSPVQVSGTTWKWVNYAGEDYILAIKTDGTLWRWGGNPVGAGGDNLPGTSPARRSSPVQVGTNTTWAYAGGNRNGHSIATKTDGTLWCWGDNSKGQCGQNTNAASSYSGFSSPTQVGSGTDWNYDNGSKIVAAYQRVYAIKTDGTLWGWGRTVQGQLGQNEGGYKDYSSPVQIPGTNWSTISSISEVIATKTDGTLWTWGDNGIGKGMLNSDVDRSSPTQVPGTWNSGQRGIRSGGPFFALKVE